MHKGPITRILSTALAALALAVLATVASPGAAQAGMPGDGCGYDIPVGHRTNISIRIWIVDGVYPKNAGYIDQWYSAGCRRTVAHFHTSDWWQRFPYKDQFGIGLEVMDNRWPSGQAIRGEGWQYSSDTRADTLGKYSYGVPIEQDDHSFSTHAVIFNNSGTAVCETYTDTHNYNTGGNTSGHDTDFTC